MVQHSDAVAAHGADTPRRARRQKRRRAPLSFAGVFGELLITAGLVVLGYILWQPWYTSTVVTSAQTEISSGFSEQWLANATPPSTDGMPVTQPVGEGEVFGVLHVPAFQQQFANTIAEGVSRASVLDLDDRGLGRYTTTQLPGEPGNFAVAGHRSGPLINSLREMMNLRVGDPIFVETPQGWYTYRFRSIEYVLPEEVDVLNAFPRQEGAIIEGTPGTDSVLTMTTCHPKWAGSEERAIAYAVLEGWQPLSDGPPAELVELNPSIVKEA